MDLEKFNTEFIPSEPDHLKAKEPLPVNPQDFVPDRAVVESLGEYFDHPLYPYFQAGMVDQSLHFGIYNKAEKGKPERRVPQVKADTTRPAFFSVLSKVVPSFAKTAVLSYGKKSSPQYTLLVVVENERTDYFKGLIDYSREVVESALLIEDVSDFHLAILAGILATDRGAIRVVKPTKKHDPNGDTRIQLDFKRESHLHRIFKNMYPEEKFIKRIGSDRDNRLRIVLAGEDAVDLCANLARVWPPILDIRPEINLLIYAHYSNKLSPTEFWQAYTELMGDFYRPKK
ncbi:hypothetical protein GW755_01645 [bacterium]|nr:hypothetical protein [bacterium]